MVAERDGGVGLESAGSGRNIPSKINRRGGQYSS